MYVKVAFLIFIAAKFALYGVLVRSNLEKTIAFFIFLLECVFHLDVTKGLYVSEKRIA